MISKCNVDFESSIVNVVRSENLVSNLIVTGTYKTQTAETTSNKTDKPLLPTQEPIVPITNTLPKKEHINVPTTTPIHNEETHCSSYEAETSSVILKQPIDNVLTQTKVNGYARYTPVSDAVLLEILLDYCDFLKDNNVVSRLRNLCTTTTVSGHAELAKGLKHLKEHFEGLLEEK
jgi:hypothetical protein